jgi:hypothetical protein
MGAHFTKGQKRGARITSGIDRDERNRGAVAFRKPLSRKKSLEIPRHPFGLRHRISLARIIQVDGALALGHMIQP